MRKMKTLLAWVLALALVFANLPATALAADLGETAPQEAQPLTTVTAEAKTPAAASTVASGTCGDNLTWVLDDTGTLTISGSGAMTNWDDGYHTWRSYSTQIKHVVVESGVNSIGDHAFYPYSSRYNNYYSNLISVTLPDSLNTIGEEAFYGCSALETINIPDKVNTIGDYAFGCCDALTSITMGARVRTIGYGAFADCDNLETVVLNDRLESIGSYAFAACKLKEVVIPDSVTSIGTYAFYTCKSLTDVTLSNSLTSVGAYLFDGCSSLTNVNLGTGLTQLPDYMFQDCTNLPAITIPENVTSISQYAFSGCSNLMEITIPDSVTNIANYAFYQCYNLEDVYYTGTAAQWDEITIGTDNTGLDYATIHTNENVESITIQGQPKTSYKPGEALDTTGLTLTATYANGSTREITEGFTVTGFDPYTSGIQTLTVTFNGCTATYTVEVAQPGIVITTPAAKLDYLLGQELDTTGLTLTATYANGTTQVVTEGFTVMGFDPETLGQQTLTVIYGGFATTYTVNVKKVIGIGVKTAPDKQVYMVGEPLDTTGLTLIAVCSDGSTETLTEGFTVSGYDLENYGTQTITVTYDGFTATFTVLVRAVLGIGIHTEMRKTVYWVGESLDTTGLEIVVIYSDGDDQYMTEGFTVTGYDPTVVGTQWLTVSYDGHGAQCSVTVRELVGVGIMTPANKLTYVEGEPLDITGLTLIAVCSDGSTETLTEGFTVTGFDPRLLGTQTLTATFRDCSTTFEITVEGAPYPFEVNGTIYESLDEAVAVASAQNPVKLRKAPGELVLTQRTYLDLNGFDVPSLVTGSYKLYVLDSATADYDVADGIYGKILSVDNEANVQATAGYMMENNAGILSFHKFAMDLTDLVVNTEKVGITYKAAFQGDQFVKSQIAEFGVALRAYTAPNSTSIWADPDCKTHVAMSQTEWSIGSNANSVKCVYVSNILDVNESAEINKRRAQIEIYGCTYIKLTDGTMIFGDVYNYSLMTAMQHMDRCWDQYLTADDKAALQTFYTDWEDVMEDWADINNIRPAIDLPV